MANHFPARRIDAPQTGYFCRQRVPMGWEVPGRICQTNDGLWYAVIDGEPLFPPRADPHDAGQVMEIWQGWQQIDEVHYRWLNATREWAALYDPTHPAVNARKPVDFRTMRPVLVPVPKGST